ncbi:sigma-70 family RNA polymerase sigma factor [Brevibacillus antibioticus]|uniref:Sigma-70 family RNA polymerase sigma factor n=2 Tax=Brevibacillus antibioticus TaxID=2570228 RepID=A0A4U2YEN8_9BACL|nr:sigma-70 family RNA polymerase sigma factor [Brevibacillus antibioticus]
MNPDATLEWLMDQFGENVFHLVYMTVKDHALAEDITQDVFIKAYRNLGTFRGDGNIKHWLYKITINETKKHFRSWSFRHIWATVDDRLVSLMDKQAKNHVEEETVNRQEREEAFHLIMSLSTKLREVIILHYCEELSIKEMAHVLSVTEGVVRTRLHRARKHLRKLMVKEEG